MPKPASFLSQGRRPSLHSSSPAKPESARRQTFYLLSLCECARANQADRIGGTHLETILKELERTWEEVRAHDEDLRGKHVRLQIVESDVNPEDVPSARQSTAADLLRHSVGWSGDNFEECLKMVYDNRTEARF